MDAKRAAAESSNGKSKADAQATAARFADTVHETIDRAVDSGHPALDRLAEQAHDTVSKVADAATKAGEGVSARTERMKEAQAGFAEDCRLFVHAHPLKSLLYAAAAGFLLNRLLDD
jgi:ElaB/YqjD/DUF883 family membrane-anchored ribosome-binding protein